MEASALQPVALEDGATAAAVSIKQLSKTFPGQRALVDLSLEIRRGEVHALVGQNGSGKSTLIKILSGFHKPDPGAVAWLGGEQVELGRLPDEHRSRMAFVHQDLALVPSLTVRENLGLEDGERGRLRPVERRRERTETRRLLSMFGVDVDPDATVAELTPFERSAVAIVRALNAIRDDAYLLVLDEPTAALGAVEVQQLFAILRRIKERGVAILYVSHILPEVLEIAERISVLRDGRRVATRDTRQITEEQLVELIVGRSVERASPMAASGAGERPALAVRSLACTGVEQASFEVRHGEVLGLTGLIGSGYEEIVQCLSGSRRMDDGVIEIGGREFSSLTPAAAMKAGIASIPADRRELGLIPHFTIAENITLPLTGEAWRHGHIDRKAERRDVHQWLEITGVVPPDPTRLVQELSGGNQQKVLLAKALRLRPEVLVLAEPTQAVDVGASASIRRLITELAEAGRAVIVASSDGEELEQICHRVLITWQGRISCELVGADITEDRILLESQFEGGDR